MYTSKTPHYPEGTYISNFTSTSLVCLPPSIHKIEQRSCEIDIGWRGERIFIKVWKPLPSIRVLKPCVEARKGEPKRTISTNIGLGLLQMVSELETRRCISKEAEP